MRMGTSRRASQDRVLERVANRSVASGFSFEGGSATPRADTSHSRRQPSPRRPHANTLPNERTSSELQNPPSSSSDGSTEVRCDGGRRSRCHRRSITVTTRNNHPLPPSAPCVHIPQGQSSPTIVVSSDPDTSSPAHSPVSNPPAASSPSEPLPTPSKAASPPSS